MSPQSQFRHFEEPLDKTGKHEEAGGEPYTWQAPGKFEDETSLNLYNMNPFHYKVKMKK